MTRDEAERFAKQHGYRLTSIADNVLKAIDRRDGNCPCRQEDIPCPCPGIHEDIKKRGTCHCHLFCTEELSND